MSTAERNRDRDERDEERDEEKDPRKPLTQREVFEFFLRDLAARPFVIAALGSLAMIFLVMFSAGSDIGGVIVVLFGLASLAFRWIAGPPFLLIMLLYFHLFPFAVPDPDSLYSNPFEVRETHFRVTDVILVLSVLVYLRSFYRLFGMTQQSMPQESVFYRKGEYPTRRPPSHVEQSEIVWLIAAGAVLVIVGQLAWWLVNSLEFTPADEEFPLRWADDSPARYRRTGRSPGEFRPGAHRFFVMLGVLFFGFLLVRLVFGYWRMRMMGAAEGAMVLADTSWAESHRERVRVEKWRIRGREKAKEAARKEAEAERQRRDKEKAKRERTEERERKSEREPSRRRRDREDEDDRGERRRKRDRDEDEREDRDEERPRRRWE